MKSARGIRKGFTEWVVFELLMLKLVLIEKVQVYQIMKDHSGHREHPLTNGNQKEHEALGAGQESVCIQKVGNVGGSDRR